MAKEPLPGRVKTRLCPPYRLEQAAMIAEAALADTLDAVSGCGADRRILALDGSPGPWLPAGFEVVAQGGGGLAERLTAAWQHAGGPGFQIGMDTPQVTPRMLDQALTALDASGPGSTGRTAVLGPATDGGWWGIGLRGPNAAVFSGLPMSTEGTGQAQRARLVALGLTVTDLPGLCDIDTAADLEVVAGGMSSGRTPAVLAAISAGAGVVAVGGGDG